MDARTCTESHFDLESTQYTEEKQQFIPGNNGEKRIHRTKLYLAIAGSLAVAALVGISYFIYSACVAKSDEPQAVDNLNALVAHSDKQMDKVLDDNQKMMENTGFMNRVQSAAAGAVAQLNEPIFGHNDQSAATVPGQQPQYVYIHDPNYVTAYPQNEGPCGSVSKTVNITWGSYCGSNLLCALGSTLVLCGKMADNNSTSACPEIFSFSWFLNFFTCNLWSLNLCCLACCDTTFCGDCVVSKHQ